MRQCNLSSRILTVPVTLACERPLLLKREIVKEVL